ncbi:MAG: phosphoglycerate kinase [Candidatus Nealsonbacteria bacterium]
MRTLKKVNLNKKRVLLRVDFNVPLSKRGDILDDFRIKQTLPTINYLLDKKAKVILISHLGRPKLQKRLMPKQKKFSLEPIAQILAKMLQRKVKFYPGCVGEKVQKEISGMKEGEVLLLENLRFYQEEEKADDNFAKELSKLADFFVNDAFGVSHRAHASIVGVTKYLPSAAGLLLEKEVNILRDLMRKPEKPLVAIIGGAKVETKAVLINKISEKADYLLVGGLINREITAKDIYLNFPKKIVAPVDEIDKKDIGPETVKLFRQKIFIAKTIFFNGVLGQTENASYKKGTEEILKAIVKSGAFSVIGGGDTVEFVNMLGLTSKFNHVSTGGGAMIAFLAGEKLPGIEVLK